MKKPMKPKADPGHDDKNLDEIAQLLHEALDRINNRALNGRGGLATGGIYWRLSKAIRYFDSRMDSDEGEHAATIRIIHGLVRPPE